MSFLLQSTFKACLFANNQLLIIQQTHKSHLPEFTQWPAWLGNRLHEHEMMIADNAKCYIAELKADIKLPANYHWVPLKTALYTLGTAWFGHLTRAYQIIQWDKNFQYCGHCGAITDKSLQSFERRCDRCELLFFPRLSPAIIVMIRKDQQILLARAALTTTPVYGLIAGFVEPGETLEQAVHREVKEEVNIKIKNVQYFGSQPWPFPDSLMIAFKADYAAGEIILNDGELVEAGWYDAKHLPPLPSPSMSIARQLIDDFIQLYDY